MTKQNDSTTTTTKEATVPTKTKAETKKDIKTREDAAHAVAAASFAESMSKVTGKIHSFPATLEATPKIPYPQVLKFATVAQLLTTHNVRNKAADEKNARRLLEEIRRDGLEVALLGNINPDVKQDGNPLSESNIQRLKGKGRIGAIALGFEVYPEAFEALFPNGLVPYYAIECSGKDAVGFIMDHGDEAPLEDGLECMRMAWMLFGEGWSIQEIAISQASTLARFSKKVKDGGGENWKLREGYLDDARLTPDPVKRAELLVKADAATVDAFYGQLQCRKREESLPYVVDSILYHKQGKTHEPGSSLAKVKFVPKLSTAQIADLERAFKADRKKDKACGKAKPGTLFKALWAKIITDQQKPGSKKASTAKGRSRSASKLRDMADADGMSAGVSAVINMAANTGDEAERAANLKATQALNEQVLLIEDGIRLVPEAYNAFVKAVMDARLEEEQNDAAQLEADAADADEAAKEVNAA